MNKKEVLEIRKQFTPANCAITRISGCYVDHEKEKRMTSKDAFLSLPEEVAFKYFDIFKRTLSGSLGKNLLNMEFPTEQESPDGKQEFLMRLRKSKLTDIELLDEFYDKIIESYDYAENYYIVLIHAMYDIPGKGTDGAEIEDASEEVYEFLLCSICPVQLSKAGLTYNVEHDQIENRIRDWIVDKPDKGFLFPAFNERTTDIHSVLYYTKKSADLQQELIDEVLGAGIPKSADEQKESFKYLVQDVMKEQLNYENVRFLHDKLNELVEEHAEDPEPFEVDKNDVRKILQECVGDGEELTAYDQYYNKYVGEKGKLLATNIAEMKTFNLRTPNVNIKVDSDRADLVETKVIDGRPCVVIAVDGIIEVNGIDVVTVGKAKNHEV
ncbi:MAG: DUF4317 domain-containing protein [Ruminococcus sp.]|uniref:DUF4317 domain-containing protein n=1 Tax=Ruminococcus sp. TaxID=41978 RepID=UPI0039965D1F